MKALVVYSSRTGNTRKIAEAIAAVLPGCEIHPVESAPAPEGYDCLLYTSPPPRRRTGLPWASAAVQRGEIF